MNINEYHVYEYREIKMPITINIPIANTNNSLKINFCNE